MITKNAVKQDLKNIKTYCKNKSIFNSSYVAFFNTLIEKYTKAVISLNNANYMLLFNGYYLSGNNCGYETLAYDLGCSLTNITRLNGLLIDNLVKYFNEN